MKKMLLAATLAVVALGLVLTAEKVYAGESFGPSSLALLGAMALLAGLLLATRFLLETRHREAVARTWLVVLSVLATYAAVDVVAGYLLIKPMSPPLVADEYRHHKLVPNTYSYFEQRDFAYYQRVNNAGLRGRDIDIRKPADRYRIAMLGDSFTMGKGVEDAETFSAQLEQMLKQGTLPFTSKTVEVLNAGVDSYAPVLSYIQLTRDLEPLDPDMVVLNLDVSDLVQESTYRRQAVFDANGEVIAVRGAGRPEPLSERIRAWTERHLYLTRLLLFHVNKLFDYKSLSVRTAIAQANFEVAKHTLAEDSEQRDEQWRNMFGSILRIKSACDSRSRRFLLAVYPWGHQVSPTEWVPGRYGAIPANATVSDKSLDLILRFAERHGIEVLNFFPRFRAHDGKSALYFKYDNHMTREGHRLMALGFAKYLEAGLRKP